ncbi:hypothetical protein RB653_009581 [Dictyostelium firmibasis]|uniref:Uncharacterized protein n=1 Tax=Dictyostelium firmibasis TaxID=79012 RepID=A0AAN7U1Z0_9MYCE
MNNSIIFLLLSLVACSSVVYGVQYLHMEPYANSDCKGEIYGAGYALQIDLCFGINYQGGAFVNNFKVSLDDSGQNATVSQFKDTDTSCSTPNTNFDKVYNVGECYEAPGYGNSDDYEPTNFVLISIQNNPHSIPTYGYRSTTYGDSQCMSNPQFYIFYTNNTEFNIHSDDYSKWYCVDNQAYETFCEQGEGTESCFTNPSSSECTRNFLQWHEDNYIQESC